jgi:hypothetical protein
MNLAFGIWHRLAKAEVEKENGKWKKIERREEIKREERKIGQ